MSSDIVQLHLPHESSRIVSDREQTLCKAVAQICNTQIDNVRIINQNFEHGLWVAISLPKLLTSRLTGASSQAASPLWSMFQNAQVSRLTINLPNEKFEHLQPSDENLLRLLYLGMKQVIVRSELGGGYSGARVLLIELIDQNNRSLATQIAKLATAEEIFKEKDRYSKYVENFLPRISPRLKNVQVWTERSGLCYDFIDGGVLGRTKTLEKFYQAQHSAEPIIQTLRDLMQKELGESWYRETMPHTIPFAAEYGLDMVEHLLIGVRPGLPDGIWLWGQEPTVDSPYKRVDRNEIVSTYPKIVSGTLLQLSGLIVQEVKVDSLKLYHPEQAGVIVKVRYAPDSAGASKVKVGDSIVICGEVIHNRRGRLETIVLAAFSNYKDFALEIEDLKSKTLNWQNREVSYPNPLRYYTSVLDTVLRGRKSLVHGDLHLRNILVDETGRGYLIDFALISERHNIFDFIKLETYIRQMILSQHMDQFSFKAYLEFEEQLTKNSLNGSGIPPEHTELRKAYNVIKEMRTLAAGYMAQQPPDWRGEYFSALFLYNLAVLKYQENHGHQAARLAFGTAAVLIKYIQGFDPLPPPPLPEPLIDKAPLLVHDKFTQVEIRIKVLLSKLESSHPEYLNILAHQERLLGIINRTRTFGDTRQRESDRLEALYELDRICLTVFGHPFHTL